MKKILWIVRFSFLFVPMFLFAYDARNCDIDGDGDVDGNDFAIFSQHYGGVYKIWYLDSDEDGYGDPSVVLAQMMQPEGYVEDNTDCVDTDATIHPDAHESCDSIDNNCDGIVDNNDLCIPPTVMNSIGMVFNSIQPGTFSMGSPDDELGRVSGEIQHTVTLTQSFYMQVTEVTQAQWSAVMGSLPANIATHSYGKGDNYPVYYVSWEDVQTFIEKLNISGEGTYRLPTEAEWEYSARAETLTAFANGDITSLGNDPNLNLIGWYRENSVNTANLIGQKAANDWGLYDMHGNVYEWCSDYWVGVYSPDPVTDPEGPSSGSYRVARGGYWGSYSRNCRSASRNSYDPANSSFSIGFRLVWVP